MGKGDLLADDLFFDLLARVSIEGVLADYHRVHQDSESPYVDLRVARIVALQELRRHVLDAAGVVALGQRAPIGTKNSEVSNFNVHVGRSVVMSG